MLRNVASAAALAAAVLTFAVGAQAAPILFTADLTGPDESPPNASPATGFAEVEFDPVAHSMSVEITFSGLLGTTTVAHIHCCTGTPFAGTVSPATTVPSFPDFPVGVTSGSYDRTFDMTLASSYNPAFVTASGGTVAGAEDALFNGMLDGEAYVNIHTTEFPAGEIRGFLVAVPEPASLAIFGAALVGFGLLRRRRAAV